MKSSTLLGIHLPGPILMVEPLSFDDPNDLCRYLETKVCFAKARGFAFSGNLGVKTLLDRLGPWLDSKSADLIFSIQIPVAFDGKSDFSPYLPSLFEKGLRMIQWQVSDPINGIFPRALAWKASKLGIWNHLTCPGLFSDEVGKGLGHWVANNPNIVHSFENVGTGTQGDESSFEIPEKFQDYGAVAPLPNIPFWKILGDCSRMLACLIAMTQKDLFRLRADRKTESVNSLGRDIRYYFQTPRDLPSGIFDEICRMVDAGGSVDITHVRSNLRKAYLIGYAMENGVIVGNSSLKHPRQVFIDRLHGITGLDFTNFVERGYTSVRPEYRAMGVGVKLLEGLTKRATNVKVFSIISEDNLATQTIALRNNTRKIATYFSDKLEKEMGVWMPETMIEDDWELEL